MTTVPSATSRLKAGQNANKQDADMLSPPPQGAEGDEASDAEPSEPTFGELIRSREEVIDVAPSRQEPTPNSLVHSTRPRTLAPPSFSSLGTVLNQALRTDDSDLLESCLQNVDRGADLLRPEDTMPALVKPQGHGAACAPGAGAVAP